MASDANANAQASAPLDILVAGTFDVRNYGDLLFPLIAAHELAPHGIKVHACSPTHIDTAWADTMPTFGLQALSKPPFALKGILVGGGNIVHLRDSRLADYAIGDLSPFAYPALWLGASISGAVHNVPVCWNAPGVPHALPEGLARHVLVRQLAEACEHFSVRDAQSADNLGRAGPLAAIVPDTAACLSDVWQKKTLAADFADLLARKGAPSDGRYVTVHLKARSTNLPLTELAARIDAFAAAKGLVPLLLPLAPCHGDAGVASELGSLLEGPKVVVDDAAGLREIAAAIAHAQVHLGASMHGYVTAASYDVPAVLIGRPRLGKFEGFLSHTGRIQDLVNDWDEAFVKAEALLEEPPMQRIPQTVRDAIKSHWASVASGFIRPTRSQLERSRFLRSYIGYCMEHEGWGWLLRPAIDKSS